jgi:hypothetical protein
MKLWWLRIYTIPSLKRYFWPLAAWAFANCLNAWFIPEIREASFIVGIYPLFVFLQSNQDSFATNVDFHLTHLSYEKLKTAILLDLFIQILTFFTFFFLGAKLPWLGKNDSSLVFDMLGTTSMFMLMLILGLMAVIIARLGIIRQRQQEKNNHQNQGKIGKDAYLILFITMTSGYLFVEYYASPYLLTYLYLGSIVCYTFLDWFFKTFHRMEFFRNHHGIFFSSIFAINLMTVYMFSHSAKEEIGDRTYSKEQRIQTFAFFRDFGFVVGPHLAEDLLSSPFSNEVVADLFRHSTQEVFDLDVETLIKNPDYNTYYHYLKTGRVPHYNLEILYKKSLEDPKPWSNPRNYPAFRKILAKHYPLASRLPKRNIATENQGVVK